VYTETNSLLLNFDTELFKLLNKIFVFIFICMHVRACMYIHISMYII